jgi:predicted acylesterase/phospholipase RssA
MIRSYRGRAHDRLHPICKIWEAARATSAASTFFDPIEIGPFRQKFVDGGLRHNNPIDIAEFESRDLWPDDDRIIISLGTGSAPGKAVTGNLVSLARRLKDIVHEADATNERFRKTHPSLVDSNRLFRFTVTHGLAEIGLEEHEAINRIATLTESYLEKSDNLRLLESCVKAMKHAGQRLNLTAPDG